MGLTEITRRDFLRAGALMAGIPTLGLATSCSREPQTPEEMIKYFNNATEKQRENVATDYTELDTTVAAGYVCVLTANTPRELADYMIHETKLKKLKGQLRTCPDNIIYATRSPDMVANLANEALTMQKDSERGLYLLKFSFESSQTGRDLRFDGIAGPIVCPTDRTMEEYLREQVRSLINHTYK